MSAEAAKKHKAPYKNPAVKEALKREWEQKTGNSWPIHPHDMKNSQGQPHFRAGTDYDFHHVIPQEVGDPHTWWNGMPLAFGEQHQGEVHKSGSALNKILEATKKEQ